MAKALTAAQRRAVTGSDPATGRLSARAEVCAALVAAGLAVPHGRGGHHSHYLTGEGLRLRAALAREDANRAPAHANPDAAPANPAPEPARGGFAADDGTGAVTPPSGGARRAAEVAAAWEGLLQIRAVLLDGVTDTPAPWERERPVHAVALALEAAGCPPGADGSAGYRVTPGADPGMVEVAWTERSSADTSLTRCAELLDRHGWQSTLHRARNARPFLLTTPRR
ncbi:MULTISPECIES: hypothetical protein [unclassified Streptomyces]|uniref:hypothetical protein n=1 Tax=unclassified Streptomyces TaxID=2593676 RepID=UPI002E2D480A|nr:hypothetical protein [Streptomyces sp. NBC_00223]